MANGDDYTEQRKSERLSFHTGVSVTLGGQVVEGDLLDIGAGGAKVCLSTVPPEDLQSTSPAVALNIPRFGEFDGNVVWTEGETMGIAFSENHKTLVGLIREAITRGAA